MFDEVKRIARHGKGAPRKRHAVAALHVLLWPVLAVPRLLWPLRGPRLPQGAPRILLIRIDGIGDLLMTSAIYPALRKAFPQAQIDLLTSETARPIAELHVAARWVDSLWTMPLLGRKLGAYARLARQLRTRYYDVAIDLRGDVRNNLLMWLAGVPMRVGQSGSGCTYLLTDVISLATPHHQSEEAVELVHRLGVDRVDQWPRLPLRSQDLAAADRWLGENGMQFGRPICAMHLGAFQPSKVWPLERFVAVAKHLADTCDAQFVLVGGPGDVALSEDFAARVGDTAKVAVAAGRTPLVVTAAILSRCAAMVGNDSGPVHLAAAVRCPVVVIYGNGNPHEYRPLGPDVITLQSPHRCDPACDKACARPASFCMLDLQPHEVAREAEALIRRRTQRGAPVASVG